VKEGKVWFSLKVTQFRTVEIDSTYYGTPGASTVTNWFERAPPDFIFAAKVPQIVTHERVLKDCEAQFDEFIDRMHRLHEKLGPLLLQFPWFNKREIQADEFFRRLPYIRWLGDRKGIEALTRTWDKTIIDRTDDLRNWAGLFRQFVSRNLKVYAYANNHYAGHGRVRLSCFGICGRSSRL
jgi:uncharacterized protein YecE (DUF72 family)